MRVMGLLMPYLDAMLNSVASHQVIEATAVIATEVVVRACDGVWLFLAGSVVLR